MYDTNQFKKGLRVEIDGLPYIMQDVEFVKPGKGQAFSRVKLKNLLSGQVQRKTYKSGEKLAPADILDTDMQFLYASDDLYHFMDNSSYEQCEMPKSALDDNWKWLVDGMQVQVTLYKSQPVSVSLPNFSALEITACDPAVRGDTVTNATKNATLQTGVVVQVPLFVAEGEKIKIDTRTGEYVERVK